MRVTDGLPARPGPARAARVAGHGGGVSSVVPSGPAERPKEWFANR